MIYDAIGIRVVCAFLNDVYAMRDALAAAMAGDPDGVTAALNRTGESGVAAVRRYIDAGVPPPNAPLTVQGGWIRNFSSGRPVHVEGKGFNKPLYETGELYHAFSFEVVSLSCCHRIASGRL